MKSSASQTKDIAKRGRQRVRVAARGRAHVAVASVTCCTCCTGGLLAGTTLGEAATLSYTELGLRVSSYHTCSDHRSA